MTLNLGGGKKVVIPHRSIRTRKETDKICEDVKALMFRPATFQNHSGLFNQWANILSALSAASVLLVPVCGATSLRRRMVLASDGGGCPIAPRLRVVVTFPLVASSHTRILLSSRKRGWRSSASFGQAREGVSVDMQDYLRTSGIVACILFGAIGAVALIASGIGIFFAPFWVAGAVQLTDKLQTRKLYLWAGQHEPNRNEWWRRWVFIVTAWPATFSTLWFVAGVYFGCRIMLPWIFEEERRQDGRQG